MSSEDSDKNIQIKLNREQYNRLYDKTAADRMKITPFARALFLGALDESKEEVPIVSRRWFKLLDFILKHGTKDQREWITGTLRTFEDAIQSRLNPTFRP